MFEKWRAEFFRVAKFAVAAAIIATVFHRAGGLDMLNIVRRADALWIAGSLIAFALSIALGSFQWHLLLKMQGLSIGPWQCFKTYYSGMFVNAVVFNLAGDALRVYTLKRTEKDVIKSFAATFADRFAGLFVLSMFSLAAVGLIWASRNLTPATVKILFTFSLSVFVGFTLGTAALASRRLGNLFQIVLGAMGLHRIENVYEKIRICMLAYRKQWRSVMVVALLSCGVHSLRILGHAFSAPALGIHISPYYFFCFIPIISLATLVPLNVGGWGVPQGISTFLYGLTGVITGVGAQSALDSETVQLAAGTLTFLPSILFYLVMLFGGFFLISLFKGEKNRQT